MCSNRYGKNGFILPPVLQLLHDKKVKHSKVRALVLTPTRELAIQVSDNFKSYGAYLSVSHLAIFGGVSHEPQKAALKKGLISLLLLLEG